MSIDKSILKKVSNAAAFFQTPAQKFQTNVSLRNLKPPAEKGGPFRVPDVFFKVPGKDPTQELTIVVATEGEFDVPIPPELDDPWQSPWDAARRPNTVVEDSQTCRVSQANIQAAIQNRIARAEQLPELIRDVLICQKSSSYDRTTEEIQQAILDATAAQVVEPPDLFVQSVWIDFLNDRLAEAGITSGFVLAYVQGPDALAAHAAARGLQKPGDYPSATGLSQFIGDEVQKLAELPGYPNFPQLILHDLGRVHGDSWNTWLDKATSLHAEQRQATNQAFGKTLTAAFGDGVRTVVVPAYSASEGRKQQTRRLKKNLAEAGAILDEQQRSSELLTADAIAQAIDWFVSCTSQGALNSFVLPDASAFKTDVIRVECGNEDFKALNPPALALALTNELAARRGAPAPLVVSEARSGLLPLLLAGGGFFVGGPLGAGAGFALGTALEKR